MKRLPIIVLTLALCLLTAGCGAKAKRARRWGLCKSRDRRADGNGKSRGNQIYLIILFLVSM